MGRFLLGVAVLAALGCNREPTPPSAYQLEVVRLEDYPAGVASRGEKRARATIEQAFARYPSFVAGGDAPVLPAHVEIRVLEGEAPVLSLRVAVPAPDALRSALPDGLDTRVELEREEGGIDPMADLPLAADRLAAAIETKIALARGDDGAIVAALGSDDPNRVALALDWIRQHQMRRFADHVVPLLGRDDPRVSLAAIDCLGIIGSPEHARDLVNSVRIADRAHAHRLYDALGRLGGPEAEGFLRFAERNEDDEAMRAALQRAMGQLERGETAAPRMPADSPRARRGHR